MMESGAFTWGLPFWEQPLHRWTSMMDAGVRAAFMVSARAARVMVPRKRGLIVNISHWAAQKRIGNTIYGIAKAATDKMTADMARDLDAHGVTAVSLYPGMVRTEAVVAAAEWPTARAPSLSAGWSRRLRTIPGCNPGVDRSWSLPPLPWNSASRTPTDASPSR